MRYLFGVLCVCALGVMPLAGCGETADNVRTPDNGGTDGPSPNVRAGAEGGFCLDPAQERYDPECDEGLACYGVGPGSAGHWGTCLKAGQPGEACEIWYFSSGTCATVERNGTQFRLQCCVGSCAFYDDPACEQTGPSECDRCRSACRGIPGCYCDSVC